MRKMWSILPMLLLAAAMVGRPGLADAQMLMNGAGATFPYPIFSKWFEEYIKVDPEVRFNYQSIGSGGGIRQITERTVDFGASDGPMTVLQRKIHLPGVPRTPAVEVLYGQILKGFDLRQRGREGDRTPT